MERFLLGLKIIFGRYTITKRYTHPRVGLSEVTLRHKGIAWARDSINHDKDEYCDIEPRCVGERNHKGLHTYA